ncbi:hypothetical protein V8J88_12155 [Massilia sp. W12]|uniref:hypothetical protein n=1 Tax=Massilia sp. W12 TaxID=3126507 RepID=UPI0030CF6941
MIYELKCGDVNNFATMVFSRETEILDEYLDLNGEKINWKTPPVIEKYFDKRRKKQKERADIGLLIPGTVILSQKAHGVLAEYLGNFGELIQLACKDGDAWLYNVQTIIQCVDYDKSEKLHGSVIQEAFFEDNIPSKPCIFKDKHTANNRIYLNHAAKQDLVNIFQDANITGWAIQPAGLSIFY